MSNFEEVKENETLYIGNLNFDIQDDTLLKEMFAGFGKVENYFTVKDRGYGFVKFSSIDEARLAMEKLNDTLFMGRKLRIDFARPKKE